MHEHVYALEGLHCGACLEKVHRRLTAHPQVARAEVTEDPDQARVAAMDALTLEALNEWLGGVGDYRLTKDLPGTSVQLLVTSTSSRSLHRSISRTFLPRSSHVYATTIQSFLSGLKRKVKG